MKSLVFDKLATSLSDSERLAMLEKMSKSGLYSQSVLLVEEADEQDSGSNFSVDEFFRSLSWWERLFITLLSYVDKRSRNEVVLEKKMARLRLHVKFKSSDYISLSAEQDRFTVLFCEKLREMSDALEVLRRPLGDALGENRRDFYATLVGRVNPYLQVGLMEIIDPDKVSALYPEYDLGALRAIMESSLEDALREGGMQSKSLMDEYVRTLAHLERLVDFDFERCFACYSNDGSCAAHLLVKSLEKLSDIFFSFKKAPQYDLVLMIFLFSYGLRGMKDENVASVFAEDLAAVGRALLIVKEFNKIGLSDILRVLNADYFYAPQLLSGGEDWLSLYRNFWQSRGNRLYKKFVASKKSDEMAYKMQLIFGYDREPFFPGYRREEWNEQLFVPQTPGALGFSYYFYKEIYLKKCKKFFDWISTEGSFFKKDNERSFSDALEAMEGLGDNFKVLLNGFSANNGVYRARIEELSSREVVSGLNSFKIQVEREVGSVLEKSGQNLRVIADVLSGLLRKCLGGRYDTLTNFDELSRMLPNFKSQLEQFYEVIDNASTYIIDKRDLEHRIAHMERDK